MTHFVSNRPLLMAMVLFVTVAWFAAPAWSVTLVQDGRAMCTIVVPRESRTLVAAAQDLQDHLRKMSGAEVPIIHDANQASGVGIYIDTMPFEVNVSGRSIDRTMTWPDGYVIEVIEFDGNTGVFLSSAVTAGVQNAVYGLLEDHWGCRWYTPGEIGAHIPKRRTVTLEIPGGRQIVKPDFEKRTPWYNDNAFKNFSRKEIADIQKWYRRNRHGEPRGSAGHGWGQMYKPPALNRIDDDGDGVSDLTPLVGGVRSAESTGNGLCMSHPQSVEIAAEWFIDFFKARPEFDHWSFSQGDNMQFCECDRCRRAASNQGALMLRLSNRVIQRVNEIHPDKCITILPYQATLEPPQEFVRGHDNLRPIIVSMGVDQIRPKSETIVFRTQVERWMTMLPQAWSYDYICWSGGPWPLFSSLQRTRDFYRSVGYTGVMDEYLSRNLGTDLHMWLSARTAWDSSMRVEELLDEFFLNYFGPAGLDMRSVYERIEQHMLSASGVGTSYANLPQLYPPELIDDCLAQIAEATGNVSDRVILSRIERDVNCLKATKLWLSFWSTLGEANRTGDRSRRAEVVQACQDYLDFVTGLDGTLTLGGGGIRKMAKRLGRGLAGNGTHFSQAQRGGTWPGEFFYYDWLDQGGKIMDAQSRSGFHIGPHGLYLKRGARGEIIYDVGTTQDLKFKEVYLPGCHTGWDLAIKLALPERGHNGVQVSLDDGRTWITAFEDLDTNIPTRDLTKHVAGTNRFLLKLWVQNSEDQEILALDHWVLKGTTEKADSDNE